MCCVCEITPQTDANANAFANRAVHERLAALPRRANKQRTNVHEHGELFTNAKVLFAKTASRTDANANAFANAGVRERLPSPPGLANKQRTNANSGCSPTLFVGVFANARHWLCLSACCISEIVPSYGRVVRHAKHEWAAPKPRGQKRGGSDFSNFVHFGTRLLFELDAKTLCAKYCGFFNAKRGLNLQSIKKIAVRGFGASGSSLHIFTETFSHRLNSAGSHTKFFILVLERALISRAPLTLRPYFCVRED